MVLSRSSTSEEKTMDNLSFQPEPPPPPAPKKKTGLIIGIVAAVVVCCCIVAITAAVIYVVANPGLMLQMQGTKYTAESGKWSIYYPDGWVYEADDADAEYGEAVFGTSHTVIDEGPLDGAGFFVFYSSDPSDFSSGSFTTPEQFAASFIDDISFSFDNSTVIKQVKSTKISGYPAATTTVKLTATGEFTIYIHLTAIVTPNTYYILMGSCSESQWEQYSSSFNSMARTFKIINP
jgi:hypothetical protein